MDFLPKNFVICSSMFAPSIPNQRESFTLVTCALQFTLKLRPYTTTCAFCLTDSLMPWFLSKSLNIFTIHEDLSVESMSVFGLAECF